MEKEKSKVGVERKAEPHLSPMAYFGYAILFSIPIAGMILIIMFSFDTEYVCRRNYARYYLISLIIEIVFLVICAVVWMFYYPVIVQSLQQMVPPAVAP